MVLGALSTAAGSEQLPPPPARMVHDLLDALLAQMVGFELSTVWHVGQISA